MTENTNVIETPEVKTEETVTEQPKPTKKVAKKNPQPKTPKAKKEKTVTTTTKTPAKKTTKTAPAPKAKAVKPSTNGKTPSNEIRWTEIRVKVLNAMKALKATSATNGATSAEIAAKVKCEAHTIKHYCYKDEQLVKFGFVGIAAAVEGPGLTYYLTAKGQKATPTVS